MCFETVTRTAFVSYSHSVWNVPPSGFAFIADLEFGLATGCWAVWNHARIGARAWGVVALRSCTEGRNVFCSRKMAC